MGVSWGKDSVSMSQARQIEDLVKEYGMADANTVQTPMEEKLHLEPCMEPDSGLPYRSLLGKLLWIARCTRPDIYYAVSYLGRFCTTYTLEHYQHLLRIVRYLKGTRDKVLTYTKYIEPSETPRPILEYFSDSDWACDRNDRKSISGNAGFLFSNLLAWESKKQVTIALSSAEGEYYALTEATKNVLHLKYLLREIFKVEGATPLLMKRSESIYVDNKGAILMAENDLNNKRTKHIDIRYRFITHHIKNKEISLHYVKSEDNLADIFTKPLGRIAFTRLADRMMKYASRRNTPKMKKVRA
jgi:histone deacetylase 1/2